MIVTSGTAVETNIKSAVEFKISSNSSKLFSMLSSALYSEKELCVMHELCANAIDSHNMNGRQATPIKVVLPTRLDSFITVTDYGPGMSEENVYRFLTTYGESSKQDSNEEIGGWGIGSKSPAAVSDTWTITSKHEGIASDYLVFINGEGVPTLTKLKSVSCAAADSGLTVKIPVQNHRISIWAGLMGRVFKHYKVKPIIVNGDWSSSIPTTQPTPTHRMDNISIQGGSTSNAIICSREYTLSTQILHDEFKSDIAKTMLTVGTISNFEIGELDLSISRESLQYTKKTIAALEARFIKYGEFLLNVIDTKIAVIADPVQIRVDMKQFISEYLMDLNSRSGLISMLVKRAAKLHPLMTEYNDLNRIRFPYVLCGDEYYVANKFRKILPNTSARLLMNDVAINEINKYSVSKSSEFIITVAAIPSMKFYLNDCKDARARIRSTSNRALLINNKDQFPKYFQDRLVLASSLPKPVRVVTPRAKNAVVKLPIYMIGLRTGVLHKQSTDTFVWDKVDAYVIVDDYRSSINSIEMQAYTIYNDIFAEQRTIIGVRANDTKVLALIKAKKVPTIPAFLKAKLPSIESHKKFKDSVVAATVQPISSHAISQALIKKMKGNVSATSVMGVFIEKYADALTTAAGFPVYNPNPVYTRIEKMASMVGLTTKSKPDIIGAAAIAKADAEKVMKTYPMLKHLDLASYRVDVVGDDVICYVNIVNK